MITSILSIEKEAKHLHKLKDYQNPEKIYESTNSLVYRALDEKSKRPVVLKIFNKQYPTSEEISKFDREYELANMFTDEGVIQVYEISKIDNSPTIIMEDIGGRSLGDILKSMKLNMDEFLSLAIQITETIGNIHKHNIIHKDINPSNIIWNIEKDIVKIIDFNIATELPREITSVKNLNVLEGTLAYISPEQTGRMNRSIDYRTDFYSLGVTFYWILTGHLPFETDDLLKLVHSHIAILPVSPYKIDESIPQALSEIVMKLMAKNAEDRYQSAHGLKVDLEHCQQGLKEAGVIKVFKLASFDVSEKLQISQKLYGRDQEVEILISAFERVKDDGSELILVSGFSGIGKSMLINEIHRTIVKYSGYFVSGKFERLKKDAPYSAMIQAFTELARQILAEKESEIAIWKDKILTILGPNGKIITDIIPLFELIIGKQPEVPILGPVESQNRFNLVFQGFIKILASKDHPLVIFLDDLQWADLASLHLFKLFTTDSDIKHLIIIGAYRHNETPASHPLILTLDEIKKIGAKVNNIFLQPLDAEHVTQLVSDTLNRPTEEMKSLAELLIRKTRGNPFFIKEFLKSIYKKSLIEFSFKQGWSWDIIAIKEMQATDNVVNLMTEKISNLSNISQEVIKLGACIGSHFSLITLTELYGRSEEKILLALNEIILEGMINKIDNIYRFSHDRIQEAAYLLIPDEEKKHQHYTIGNLELQNTNKEKLREKIFYIVNQLNAGVVLVTEKSERQNLAELNLIAGKKALASNAYASALKYLMAGIELLEENCWRDKYDFTLELYQEATISAQLSADYKMMEKLAETVFQNAVTILDKVKIYEAKTFACAAKNQPLEAVRIGLDILSQLGLRMPEKPGTLRIVYEFLFVKLSLRGKTVENLINLAEMKDPYMCSIMQILSGIGTSIYYATPDLIPLAIFKSIRLSVKHGNSIYSPFYYAAFGMIYCAVLGDINTGYEWGELALNLAEKLNIKESKSRVWMLIWDMLNHWKKPMRDSIEPLLETYKIGLETGDLEYAATSASAYTRKLFYSGIELAEVKNEEAKYTEMTRMLNQDTVLNHQLMLYQTVLNLCGESLDPCELIGEYYDVNKMLPIHKKANDATAILDACLYSLSLKYHFENNKDVLKYIELVKPLIDKQISHPMIPIFNFYESLTRLALYSIEKKSVQKKHLKTVSKNQKKMKKWASHSPNYSHKYHLVEAEIARILGKELKARKHYDHAIKLAHENKFLQEEALALKLFAKFWLKLKEEKIAGMYMTESYHTYRMWGATAVVKHIEEKYGFLLSLHKERHSSLTTSTTSTGGTSTSEAIDLSTVMKLSQTLSSEIDLGRLLKGIMRFSIENAGAQRGLFIIENEEDKNLYIEAEGVADKEVRVFESISIENNTTLSSKIIHYVHRTGENIVLHNAYEEGKFADDQYIMENKIKSLLCSPITHKGKMSGILYLENNLSTNVFIPERVELLRILSSQAAISIENARLYESMEESEKNLQITLNSIGDAVIATDVEGNVSRMNPVAEELTGWRFNEAQGNPLSEVFTIIKSKTNETANNLVEKVLASGEIAGLADDTMLLAKDGTERQIADSAAPIRGFDGVIIGMVLVFRDVTEENAIQEQLRQSQKMDVIGQLAGGLAHDFNNMLSGIIGAAEIIHLSNNIDEENKNYADIIIQASTRAADLTSKLLTFGRKGEGNYRVIDIDAVIGDAISLLERSLDKKIKLVKDLKGIHHKVIGDNTQLQNAFINMGINASHAMPDGGTITYSTINLELDQIYCNTSIFDIEPGEYLEVEIRDNGSGIPLEIINRIFEPFFTTKKQGSGTGLGLAAVYGTIQNHHGAITVYSEEEVGTVFQIYLPATTEDTDFIQKDEEILRGSGTILVVDDEEIIRVTAKSMLEKFGYKVLLAEDGKDAVELFQKQYTEIDLVLMDVIMPEMNGREAFYKMREIDPICKVFISSGFTKDEDISKLKDNGLCGFVRKPYRMSELSKLLKDVLGEDKI